MKKNNLIAVLMVGAFIISALMLYASSDLIGSMHPDPHSHQDEYSVSGTIDGAYVSDTAVCTPIRENGSFYNYCFEIKALEERGLDYSFVVIFDNDEHPFNYHPITSEMESDSVGSSTYQTIYEGTKITIDVGENCLVNSFTLDSDSFHLVGLLIHSEVI